MLFVRFLMAGSALSTLTLLSFEPEFVRPAPPVLEVSDSEVVWLNLDYAPKLLWDAGMCQVRLDNVGIGAIARKKD